MTPPYDTELMPDCSKSIAKLLELLQPCTKPSICSVTPMSAGCKSDYELKNTSHTSPSGTSHAVYFVRVLKRKNIQLENSFIVS